MSNNNEYVTMLVCWKQHGRLVKLKINDDLNTIKSSIINIYHLQQTNQFDEYQIQYYDQIYQEFVDLCSETIQQFQQLMQMLSSLNTSLKNENIWHLRIIPKALETILDTSTVRIYRSPGHESINTQLEDTTSSLHSITNTEDPHAVATSQIENEDQQPTNPRNEFNFQFEEDIADLQRKQYESEVGRKKNSKSSSTGGVFLQASNLNGTNPYPTLQFQIPDSKFNSACYLYLYILTECDSNGNYYLHASKGIYDNKTMMKDKFGPIPNSDLVNPFKIQLTKDNIQQGKYEIRLRVCNIHNLSIHKHQKLRKFPELDRFMIYEDDNLMSKFTTTDLNFSSEKYHLGCILVWDYRVQDRCISKLARDDNKRKRNKN